MSGQFTDCLSAHAMAVEAHLKSLLASDAPNSAETRHDAVPVRLRQAASHAVLSGGKRLRPFLVIEAAGVFGVPMATALPVAAALECVHCYSLVHDDLPAMDNDMLRRGGPTVWAAFDEWTAILAGDALLTLAFEILSGDGEIAAPTRIALIGRLARASGWQGMVGGQCFDLEADKLRVPERPDEGHVRRLQSMKTGALIRYGAEAGAILGNASPDEFSAMSAYGRELGLAFQIADDILDAEGDAETMGKAAGKDAAAGKATLIGVLGIDAARAELARAHRAAIDSLDPFGSEADMLRAAADFIVQRDR